MYPSIVFYWPLIKLRLLFLLHFPICTFPSLLWGVFIVLIIVVEENLFLTWINEGCVFPFTYKGVTYQGCTKANNHDTPWCSYDLIYTGGWDYCVEKQGEYCLCASMLLIRKILYWKIRLIHSVTLWNKIFCL